MAGWRIRAREIHKCSVSNTTIDRHIICDCVHYAAQLSAQLCRERERDRERERERDTEREKG